MLCRRNHNGSGPSSFVDIDDVVVLSSNSDGGWNGVKCDAIIMLSLVHCVFHWKREHSTNKKALAFSSAFLCFESDPFSFHVTNYKSEHKPTTFIRESEKTISFY